MQRFDMGKTRLLNQIRSDPLSTCDVPRSARDLIHRSECRAYDLAVCDEYLSRSELPALGEIRAASLFEEGERPSKLLADSWKTRNSADTCDPAVWRCC